MPKRGAEARVGNEDSSGHGVYGFIGDLIREGKDAKFVNKKGRYVLNWSSTLERYAIYKSKKNPQFKSKNINRRKASNGLRAALLNIYKKDGAKEYKESKKVNDKDEVIERQFQMPPKVFQSLFGSKVELSDDSDHETSSTSSEADEKLQASPDVGGSPDTSDTGFEEAMDVSDDLLNMNATGTALQDNIKREDPVDLTNIETPSQIFGISAEDLDSALEEICTNSDNDVDQPGVVQDISPSSGSVKGGIQFHIMLTEALLESDTRGVAHFDGVGDVFLEKTNPYTFSGFVPAAQEAGPVLITVYTEAGRKLGITYFMYVDEMRETLKQLIKDPAQLSLFLTMWSQAHGIIGSNSDVAQTLGLFGLPDQGPLPDAKQGQSLKVLQLLVYTAAQEDAQQFLQMIFSTSAGKIVFDSYKDRTPLPEDVARANGHDDLAEFLQDVNKRLSKEHDSNSVALGTSDWLELVQAVDNIQKQTVSNDERESSRVQPKDDDNQSDYFADAETSSCGSLELIGDWSDLEEENGACTKDEDYENATIETGMDNCASLLRYPQEEHLRISLGFSEENEATEESFEDETQLSNGKDNIESPSICEESSVVNFPAKIKLRQRSSFFSLPVGRPALFSRHQETCFLQAEEMGSVSQKKGTERRDDSDSERKYATESLRQEKTTELYTSREEFLKNSSRFSEENAATEESFEDEAVFGNCQDDIESPSICEESPVVNFPAYKRLPLLRSFFQWLSRREDDLSAEQQDVCSLQAERMGSVSQNKGTKRRDDGGSRQKYAAESSRQEKTTKSKKHRQRGHWIKFETASRVRYILLTAALVTVLAGIKLGENQILHWAVGNGYTQFSKLLLKCGLNVDAPNSRMETPLHVAAKFGFIGLTDVLTKLGGNVNAKSYQQQTPLHLAVWNGHQQIAAMLLQRGSDSQRRDVFGCTPAHLAAVQRQEQMLKMLMLTQCGSALIPICSQKHMQVLKKKLQQACHYRKPDIDGDVNSGPSFLEHFGPNVCHDKCSGCFVADEARLKPKRVMEQDENIRYAEHDLECSTNTHEFLVKQANFYKELPADFVCGCVMIRVLRRLKNFSCLRPYQLWCDSFETLHPSEQCGIDGSRQPACKGNGCKEWTLACKTENATRERPAIYINTKRVKRSQIGVTFTALKTENAAGERQATLHKLNRVSPPLVTIQFALIFILVFCMTYVWYRVANMSPKFTGFMPSSAPFFILPTSKPPGSTNSSNDINWLPWKNDPLDRHKQSKRRNQQTMQKGKGKQET